MAPDGDPRAGPTHDAPGTDPQHHAAGPAQAWPTGPGPTPTPVGAATGTPPQTSGSADPRTLSLLAHLSILASVAVGPLTILAPILIWQIPTEKDPFLVRHAKEALNFQITIYGIALVAGILALLLFIVTFGIGIVLIAPFMFLVLGALTIYALVCSIIAAVRANQGQEYRYPLCIRLVS